jgi:hypothetical protein
VANNSRQLVSHNLTVSFEGINNCFGCEKSNKTINKFNYKLNLAAIFFIPSYHERPSVIEYLIELPMLLLLSKGHSYPVQIHNKKAKLLL